MKKYIRWLQKKLLVVSAFDLWVLIRHKKAPNNRGFLTDGAQGQSIFSLKAPKEPYTAAYKLL